MSKYTSYHSRQRSAYAYMCTRYHLLVYIYNSINDLLVIPRHIPICGVLYITSHILRHTYPHPQYFTAAREKISAPLFSTTTLLFDVYTFVYFYMFFRYTNIWNKNRTLSKTERGEESTRKYVHTLARLSTTSNRHDFTSKHFHCCF